MYYPFHQSGAHKNAILSSRRLQPPRDVCGPYDDVLKVLWTFKNIFGTLHDLNDSDGKIKMLKTQS